MSLKTIKNKIKSVKKIRQVTRAMEAVSAVKMRKSQQKAFAARPYAESALSILSRVSGSKEIASHPLFTLRPQLFFVEWGSLCPLKGLHAKPQK